MILIFDFWFLFYIVEASGVQIKEALQLQLDVQRHLHEQLEVSLKM